MTRQQEELDPEAEADFDRELAKMMSESLDSRKFDRKPMFDVPLPMRRGLRDTSTAGDESPTEGTSTPPNTMAFSLMTKKGNRQQVCPPRVSSIKKLLLNFRQTRSIELPSDSHFAIAMKTQKEAERAEQQRIKNLVLNYDLHESNTDQTGTEYYLHLNHFSQPNPNIKPKTPSMTLAHNRLPQGPGGAERHSLPHHQHNASLHQSSSPTNAGPRPADKSGNSRGGQRTRKLQLSDVDWYEQKPGPPQKGRERGGPHRTVG